MKKTLFIILGILVIPALAWAAQSKAVIKGTAPDSKILGEVTLTEINGGLMVEVKVSNVPPGKHGFHIHENGSCEDMGKAAGGHFNPDGVMHGDMPKDGPMKAHAGDMGNIEVGADGTGTLKLLLAEDTLKAGKYGVTGKAIILHEKEDDFGQPTGNAGGRIGCGIIQ